MKTRKFLFCHGFGLSVDYWQNILPYFQSHTCILLDLGYFSTVSPLISEEIGDSKAEYIAIGHSLGFLKLCTTYSKLNIKYLIGLNAFTNFLGFDGNLHQKRITEYKAFRKSFTENPAKTLANFYSICGAPTGDLNKLNIDILKNDLELLAIPSKPKKYVKTLVINSADDPIVPYDLTIDNFSKTNIMREVLPYGGHALGFRCPREIAERILSFIL